MQLATKILVCLLLASPFAIAAADSLPDLARLNIEFELQNRNAELVRFDQFAGKNVLLTFGFTNCAHICPMIAANMGRVLNATDKDAVGVFVSVDTERDSPEITDDYARKFGSNMVGLSGDHYQVAEAAKNFNVTFVVTKSEVTYTVQHTPSIFLISPEGQLIDVFAMNASSADIAAAMR